jgi:hypothetical protein
MPPYYGNPGPVRRAPRSAAARFLLRGAAVGATLGTLFAAAVVSFADCAGPNCDAERVIGLLGHAAGGALAGALLGLLALLLVRLARWATGQRPPG